MTVSHDCEHCELTGCVLLLLVASLKCYWYNDSVKCYLKHFPASLPVCRWTPNKHQLHSKSYQVLKKTDQKEVAYTESESDHTFSHFHSLDKVFFASNKKCINLLIKTSHRSPQAINTGSQFFVIILRLCLQLTSWSWFTWANLKLVPLPPCQHRGHDRQFKLIQARTQYRSSSFLLRTIKDWNCLPKEVVEAATLVSRASSLQTLQLSIPNPPHPQPNPNSPQTDSEHTNRALGWSPHHVSRRQNDQQFDHGPSTWRRRVL